MIVSLREYFCPKTFRALLCFFFYFLRLTPFWEDAGYVAATEELRKTYQLSVCVRARA